MPQGGVVKMALFFGAGLIISMLTLVLGLVVIFFPRLVAFIIGLYLVLVGLMGVLGNL